MNLPNIITLSRIPMMFVIVWLMYQTWAGAATLAFWLFIAAAIGDWLAGSRHAGRIAAVRGAHPRHGGAGALYIVLRRNRNG